MRDPRSGRRAEAFVARWLADTGWRLLARNLRTPYGEIDLLAVDPGGELVVVEVKARHPLSWLREEDALRPRQRARLGRALEWAAARRRWQGAMRVDLAAVELEGGRPRALAWFEDVETPAE
ncbi:MAG: YraN family protein [Planctomycetota bacterium]|nr:MAG: YraN family protein [Planctomycetota bacterium]